jgi:hypothetical protein
MCCKYRQQHTVAIALARKRNCQQVMLPTSISNIARDDLRRSPASRIIRQCQCQQHPIPLADASGINRYRQNVLVEKGCTASQPVSATHLFPAPV